MGVQITAKEAFDNLAAALDTFSDSETYQAFLKRVSKLHKYSPFNTHLIFSQNKDASKVAGFRAWGKLNRRVKKGESALTILVPITFDKEKADGTTSKQMIFKPKNCVFDISQTELIDPAKGDPVNDAPAWVTRGDSDLFEIIRDVVIADGATVEVVPNLMLNGTALGRYIVNFKQIEIVEMNTAAMACVLLHEWAHHRVHGDGTTYSYDQEEVIVESISYVIAQTLGIQQPTETSSFVYITNWLRDDKDKFKKAVSVIQKEAHAMIELLSGGEDVA